MRMKCNIKAVLGIRTGRRYHTKVQVYLELDVGMKSMR